MLAWKYIVVETSNGRVPYMFPSIIVHKEFANALHSVSRSNQAKGKAVSAGFVEIVGMNHDQPLTWRCYGRSESLNLDSIPDFDSVLFMLKFKLFPRDW